MSHLEQAESTEQQIDMMLKATSAIFQSDISIVYIRKDNQELFYPHACALTSNQQNILSQVPIAACCRRILSWPFRWPSDDREPALLHCAFFDNMDKMGFSTWFSLPLSISGFPLGIIAVGYYHFQYLVDDVGHILWEFAQDVAQALVPNLPEVLRQAVRHETPELPDAPYQQKMRRFLSNHYQLTSALWTDDGLHSIAHSVKQMLNRPTAVLDRFQSVLSICPEDARWHQLLHQVKHWMTLRSPFQETMWPLPVRTELEDQTTFVVAPIQTGDVIHGYLVIWENSAQLDDLDLIAVQEATMALAVHFYKRGFQIQRRGHGFQELFNFLLDQPEAWGAAESDAARAVGWDVEAEQRLLVGLPSAQSVLTHPAYLEHLSVLVDHLRSRLETEFPQILVARRHEAIVLSLPVSMPFEEIERLLNSIQTISLHMTGRLSNHLSARLFSELVEHMRFGISGPCTHPSQIVSAFEEASFACRLAPFITPTERILFTKDVQLYHLLRPIATSPKAKHFVSETADLLRAYDQQHGSELFKTLEVYLHHNCNLTDTSTALYIHRTTLQYRLKRIESLLNRSLDAAESKLEMQLAIIFRKIMDAEQVMNSVYDPFSD
ncbi:PucR family transcriptional regulator [Alicyclobacillus acidocaldarius]|uniref:PucR family transcriptional regulator n=1 Tax=Alicyclobacillus acidocaldarius TaxID=405212 RepID=UPI00059F0E0C|nr:helix-turn-helix domain-containing protein [Alicyclobacillus acidocaldarius]